MRRQMKWSRERKLNANFAVKKTSATRDGERWKKHAKQGHKYEAEQDATKRHTTQWIEKERGRHSHRHTHFTVHLNGCILQKGATCNNDNVIGPVTFARALSFSLSVVMSECVLTDAQVASAVMWSVITGRKKVNRQYKRERGERREERALGVTKVEPKMGERKPFPLVDSREPPLTLAILHSKWTR